MTPAELLQRLLRFDTTNPPGNERPCIEFLDGLLRDAGLETTTAAKDPDRPNLVARIPGEGSAPPLLLQGHVDVVPTSGQQWTRDPFGGEIAGGELWGRGTLDMKGGVAMFVSAALRAVERGARPAGDVVLALVSDEEAGGACGASWLADERPELFDGIRYALGEFGGFTMDIAGRTFMPIQVAEKRVCRLRMTVRGPGGHGSVPLRGGATARLAKLLRTLDRKRLPVHVTPVARDMVDEIAGGLPAPAGALARRLLDPRLTDRVLDVLGTRGRPFDAILHNTLNATVIRGGDSVNVVPAEVTVECDGRILPGFEPEDLVREAQALVGRDVEVEVTRAEPATPEPTRGLYDLLAGVLRDVEPSATPIPYLMPAVTDGRHFARLGIENYGFTPMRLPSDMRFSELIHAADERIPVDAIEFGTDAVFRVLERYGR